MEGSSVIINNYYGDTGRIKSAGNELATAEPEQFIKFSSPFDDNQYSLTISDHQGLGYELKSKIKEGFVVRFLEQGIFDYLAIKNL